MPEPQRGRAQDRLRRPPKPAGLEEVGVLPPTDAADARRLDAARKAVRAVGLALRARRLYAAGHTLVQQALLSAQDALRAYLAAFGPLGCAVAGRAVVFDFFPQPHEDDAVAEVSRSLTAAGVVSVRFLAGISTEDIQALIDALYLPHAALKRAGGAGVMLRERGVQTVALEDSAPGATSGPPGRVEVLVDALTADPGHLAARLQEASHGSVPEAERVLQELDRVIAGRPQPERDAAWRNVAAAVVASTQPQLIRVILRALREPWAASLAGRWTPALIAGIIPADPRHRGTAAEDVAVSVRALYQGPAQVRVPAAEGLDPATRERTARVLAMGDVTLKHHALDRFLDALPVLRPAQFDESTRLIERELVEAVRAEDIESVVRILTGLAVCAHRLPDARADVAQSALHRMLSTAVRDLVARNLPQITDRRHPLRQALEAAPAEAVPMLLELLADEDRLHIRRGLVLLLAALARDHVPLLAEHLTDPRWYVARNVVTTLGEMRDPACIPYFKAALQYNDLRVRKEALAALGGLGTAEAVAALAEALRHPDAETRAAAARWHQTARGQGP